MSTDKPGTKEGLGPPAAGSLCEVCGRQACLAQMPGVGVTDEMEIECWRLGYERERAANLQERAARVQWEQIASGYAAEERRRVLEEAAQIVLRLADTIAATPGVTRFEALCEAARRIRSGNAAQPPSGSVAAVQDDRQEGKGPAAHAERLRAGMLRLLQDGFGPGGGYYGPDQRIGAAVSLLLCGWGMEQPTAGAPAAPSPVLEGKDPGGPHPPSVSAEHEVALEIWRAPGWAAREAVVRTYGDKREAAAYARGLGDRTLAVSLIREAMLPGNGNRAQRYLEDAIRALATGKP